MHSEIEKYKKLLQQSEQDHIEFIAKLKITDIKLDTKEEQQSMLIEEVNQMTQKYYAEVAAHRATKGNLDYRDN